MSKYWLTYIFGVLTFLMNAQNTADPVVISNGGRSGVSSSGNYIQYTIGEAVITTAGSNAGNIATQGFHQPQSIVSSNPLVVFSYSEPASCPGLNNGYIIIDSITGCSPPYIITFNGNTVTDTILDLDSGTYEISITAGGGCAQTELITVELDEASECGLSFYNAFSPNGDMVNDYWRVNNVESYPVNSVSIFDRWGVAQWEADNYNNLDVVFRGENMSGTTLPDGTYFFIFTSGDRVEKGYIEITR